MRFNLLVVGMVVLGLTGAGRVGEARGPVAARPAPAKPVAVQPARAAAPVAAPQQDNRGVDVLDVGEGQDLGPVGKFTVVKMAKDAKTQEIRFIDDETNKVYTQEVPADLKFMVVSGVVAVDPKTNQMVVIEPGMAPKVQSLSGDAVKPIEGVDPGWKPAGGVDPGWKPVGGVDPGWKPVEGVDPGWKPTH